MSLLVLVDRGSSLQRAGPDVAPAAGIRTSGTVGEVDYTDLPHRTEG